MLDCLPRVVFLVLAAVVAVPLEDEVADLGARIGRERFVVVPLLDAEAEFLV